MAVDDAGTVLQAVRLGWAVAEVCGRNRPDGPNDPDCKVDASGLTGWHALHLRSERSAVERRIEAQQVLASLAKALEVDKTDADHPNGVAAAIDSCAKQLSDARAAGEVPDAEVRWKDLQMCLYKFDAHVQDVLSGVSELQACGYQLGRGLAETFWASTTETDDAGNAFLRPMLDEARCNELSRYAGRIGNVLPAYTACAIAGSLNIWKEVVKDDPQGDPWWKQAATRDCLYQQQRRWFELVVAGQEPTSLIKPFAVLKSFRATGAALHAFGWQLFWLVVSIGALAVVAVSTAAGSHSATVNALFGIGGVVGLSATTLQAKVKSSSQALVKRLREDAYTDLIVLETTIVPPRRAELANTKHPISDPTDRAKTAALRNRTLTTPVAIGA